MARRLEACLDGMAICPFWPQVGARSRARHSSDSLHHSSSGSWASRQSTTHSSSAMRSTSSRYLSILLLVLSLLAFPTNAAFIDFQNCIDSDILHSDPLLLQFIPLHFSASMNSANSTYPLNVTVYGNVSGIETQQPYPAPNDPQWSNPNDTVGKIVDLSEANNVWTTMFARFNVLSYTPYQAPPARFCDASIHGSCPLGPAFYVDPADIARLPAFSVAHELGSSYAFTSITATVRVVSGEANKRTLGCVSATITPDLGGTLRATLRYLPLIVLIAVGAATIFAAVLSPWGSEDPFRWTSNYGGDQDLLRLVTPGFGDCLQYIQFIILTGSLTLNYPGFYQPVVSSVGWSALMFNESFVSDGKGTQSVVDGIYHIRSNGTYGLDRMSQLVGMSSVRDVWAGMMVWLLIIVAAVVLLTQLIVALRWVFRRMGMIHAEDLRSLNWPFTAGNVIRVIFNYFLLPLVSLSMFQLVIARRGPTYAVAIAAIVIVALIAFAARFLLLISRTKPRAFLFDDLPTVLLWGPLYNTYCDDQAGVAFLSILLTFIRGIAIGAVQASGIAQLVLLAICEIIFALALNAIRPFPSATSMNVYHTFFALVRLIAILLSVAFVPSLGVSDAPRGWIGYAILLLHAAALAFGFFLNAIQTLVEVAARLAGAGGRNQGGAGATRGGLTRVFGMRQLSKRVPRNDTASRHSMASGAVLLSPDLDSKSLHLEAGRVRSLSASSTILLNQQGDTKLSPAYDGASVTGTIGHVTPSPIETSGYYSPPGGASHRTSASMSPRSVLGVKQAGAADPYFRKPRRATMDLASATMQKHSSLGSEELSKRRSDPPTVEMAPPPRMDAGEGPSNSGRATPVPGPGAAHKDEFEDVTNDLTRTKTDYAVREVDFYYGVRGPALSSGTRKLKTGPADPTGPVSSATGWFKGIFGGKTKEKGKGFEVVRSSRAPPPGLMTLPEQPTSQALYQEAHQEEYHDAEEQPHAIGEPRAVTTMQPRDTDVADADLEPYLDEEYEIPKVDAMPPSLPAIDTGGGIELPSRIGSQASKVSKAGNAPAVPNRSAHRLSQGSYEPPPVRLSTVSASPPSSPPPPKGKETKKRESYWPVHKFSSENVLRSVERPVSGRIPFSSAQPYGHRSNRMSTGGESTTSSVAPYGEDVENTVPNFLYPSRHSSSALGAHAPDLRGDRPSSVGYVQQHRASDHIHHSPDSPEHAGSSAEFIGEHR